MCKYSKNLRDFDSLFELLDYFDTEEKCEDYLSKLRWNGNPTCSHCGHDKVYEIQVKGRGKRYKCASCRKHASVRVGTIFQESKIPLRKWFVAIYLVTAHKKGVSSHQLAKDIKVTQKSAWFVLQRIRETFKPDEEKFSENSEVEVDETFIGGLAKNKHKSKIKRHESGLAIKENTPVLGIIERGGKVYALPVDNTKSRTLIPIMRAKVAEGAKIYSDEYISYRTLEWYYEHEVVKHRAGEYVNGNAHTNSIESFWAILKRGIFGIYHHTSTKHLSRYVNEFAYRYNNREFTDGSKFDITLSNVQGRLDYKTLTKKSN